MSHNRVFGARAARVGATAAAVALAIVGIPAAAHAQPEAGAGAGTLSAESIGQGSAEGLGQSVADQIPDEITIGGPGFGSEGLRAVGSGEVADTALSVGQVIGSVAPLEAVGSAGGSAAASVASSGSLPGSTYINPTGSVGSGTIGLGSVSIPEIAFPVLSVTFAGGYFEAMGERQQAGELYPHELDFWHGVVEGSAEGGAAIENAAQANGVPLPGELTGSIDAVQIAADTDPYEDNERRRLEAIAAAEAEAAGETAGE